MNSKVVLPGRCYWIIKDRFLAGNYPYNPGIDEPFEMLKRLFAVGIDAFIDLTEEDELIHYDQVISQVTDKDILYFRFETPDYSIPTVENMRRTVKKINELLDSGRNIYLHCRGGIGRSGTAIGCWLRSQGLGGEEALEKLAELFKPSNVSSYLHCPETDEQRSFVRNYTC